MRIFQEEEEEEEETHLKKCGSRSTNIIHVGELEYAWIKNPRKQIVSHKYVYVVVVSWKRRLSALIVGMSG